MQQKKCSLDVVNDYPWQAPGGICEVRVALRQGW